MGNAWEKVHQYAQTDLKTAILVYVIAEGGRFVRTVVEEAKVRDIECVQTRSSDGTVLEKA